MRHATVVLLLVAVSPVRGDDAEEKAVAFVRKLGGKVERGRTADGDRVVAVDMWTAEVTDDVLKELAALKHLGTVIY